MNKEELQQYTLNCLEFLGYELFKVKRAYRDMYGSFEEWSEPEDVYIKNPTKEFKEHLILSNPEDVGLDWNVKLFDSYYYPCTDKFYSDWNKIMEVVEAIEKLSIKYVVGITDNSCDIHSVFVKDLSFNTYVKNGVLNKKETVVQAINEFLIWYKQNK